ncbi:MAG: YesL family protein [Devosia sp.]
MNSLFSQDSPLMRGLGAVADVMLLNLLFIATSLPVITLGASLTALNFTAMRIATGECNSVSGDYFRSFRRNFRQGTIVALVLAAVVAVLAAWYVVVTNLAFGNLAELILLAVWYVLVFNVAAAALFVFPYLASFEGSTRQVLRNARLLSWKHPFTALAAMALIALCVAVTAFYPQFTAYGIAWLLFGFAGIATANGVLFARIFNSYIAAAAANPT